MSDKKVDAFVIRKFEDRGTKQRFKAETVVQLDEGAFDNYAAAGLVRAATDAEAKPTAESGKTQKPAT